MPDPIERLLADTLASRADRTQAGADLAERARATLTRRESRRARIFAVTAAVAVVVAIAPAVVAGSGALGGDDVGADGDGPPVPEVVDLPVEEGMPMIGTAGPAEPAQPGWRWESYAGVELQVPDDLEQGTTDAAYCVEGTSDRYVGRPGPVLAIMCPGSGEPPEFARWFVWFASTEEPGRVEYPGGWVRETRQVGDQLITVQLDDADVVRQVLGSARVVEDLDANGCPPALDVEAVLEIKRSDDPVPDDATPSAASLCQYGLRPGTTGPDVLRASGSLSGDDAHALLAAARAAPVGGGPDRPESCDTEVVHGDQALVVRLQTDRGDHGVVVTYEGCENGVFGVGEPRALTADVLRLAMTGGALRP